MDAPKVTVKPSEEIIAQVNKQFTVTDAKNRVLSLKKPGPLAQFRLVEALGKLAENKTYLGMTLPILFLSAIDGDPVIPPGSKREIEALVQQLDEEGLEALMRGVEESFGALDPDADKAAIKN
jgi:hypothetical protein